MSSETITKGVANAAKDATILQPFTVSIRRSNNGLLPTESIGAEVEKKYKIGSGILSKRALTFEEEEMLLPSIINMSPKSEHWSKSVDNYFQDISVNVPDDGLDLEIGFKYLTEEDRKEGEKVSPDQRTKFGFPIKASDYVLYRYCLVYGRVANSIEDVNKSAKIRFYIYDPEIEKREAERLSRTRAEAYALFLSKGTDYNFMIDVFSAIGRIVQNDVVYAEMETYVSTEPAKFLQIAKDQNLTTRAFLERALRARVLSRMDNTEVVYFGDVKLGSTTLEVVDKLRSDAVLPERILAQMNAQVPQRTDYQIDLTKDAKHVEEQIAKQLNDAAAERDRVLGEAGEEAQKLLKKAMEDADKIRKEAAQAIENAAQAQKPAQAPAAPAAPAKA